MKKSKMGKKGSQKQGNDSSVKVIIRVRPLISIEKGTYDVVSVGLNEQSVIVQMDQFNQMETKFDQVMTGEKNQKEVFENIESYIKEIINGYNLTIFAYGQTGSGKTFTMFGKDWQNNFEQVSKIKRKKKQSTPLTNIELDDHHAGIIPRSVYHLFKCLQILPGKYNIFCSFLQIYNQKIYDLLQDSPKPNPLNIHESKLEGIFVEGLGEFQVDEYADCLELLSRGQKNRLVRQTSMNAKSSRSHTVFQIMLESVSVNEKGQLTRARLNLCDLAGSQKINKRENMENQHLEELKNINLSLTTLGKVIYSLSKGTNTKNTSFFRQSKLTRLLQDSLMGSTNTFIIGAISPSSKCRQETINTLKFTERARHIKLVIKPSMLMNQNNELIQKLQNEMQQLKNIIKLKEEIIEKIPKNLEEKVSELAEENQLLRNQTYNKKSNIESLMEENRRMKQALVRMERVALDDFSEDLSISDYSDQKSNFSDSSLGSSRKKQIEKKQRQLEIKKKVNQQRKEKLPQIENKARAKSPTQNSHQNQKQKKMSRPQNSNKISPLQRYNNNSSKISKSLPSQELYPAELKKDAANHKRRIISRLQNLEQIQRSQQLRLIKDLDVIEEQQKYQSERVHHTIDQDSRESSRNSFTVKARKKIDYSERIRELQRRLRK